MKPLGVLARSSSALATAPFIPFGPGVSTISAPKASSRTRRSRLMVSGIVKMSLYPYYSCDESQSDARVAAGRLDQHGLAGLNSSCAFRLGDHADANAILYAGARIRAFQFRDYVSGAARCHFVKPYKGRITDQLCDVICDLHGHLCP